MAAKSLFITTDINDKPFGPVYSSIEEAREYIAANCSGNAHVKIVTLPPGEQSYDCKTAGDAALAVSNRK